jgi:hypothetical protein
MESEVSLQELLDNPESGVRSKIFLSYFLKYSGKDSLTPKEKFLHEFPVEWENKFEAFDDKIIGWVQKFHIKNQSTSIWNKIFGYIFMVFSFIMTCSQYSYFIICLVLTQIENGPSICIFLFIIGLDHVGVQITFKYLT